MPSHASDRGPGAEDLALRGIGRPLLLAQMPLPIGRIADFLVGNEAPVNQGIAALTLARRLIERDRRAVLVGAALPRVPLVCASRRNTREPDEAHDPQD